MKRKLKTIQNQVNPTQIDDILSSKLKKLKIINNPLKKDVSTQTELNLELYITSEINKYKIYVINMYKSLLYENSQIKTFKNIYI
jgi:hypothetical protein